MSKKVRLWSATVIVKPEMASLIEETLGLEAAAVSVLAPPRKNTAKIEAIFETKPSLKELTSRLALATGLIGVRKTPAVTLKEVGNLDWLKKVATDFPPLKIGRWTVYGAAHKKAVKGLPHTLEIDATSAFGTGEHPTTRGCLLLLDKLLKQKPAPRLKKMADIGCGSGILAMAFAEATGGKAVAVDLDPESVKICKNNVKNNKLGKLIQCGKSDGYKAALVKKAAPFDLIMSNIFAEPLAMLAPDLKKSLKPGGTAILAGLLTKQAPKVIAAHKKQGLILQKKVKIGEWTILALNRPAKAK